MSRVSITALPDDARLWVFAASKPLQGRAAERLLLRVDAFLSAWAAHGAPLTAARDWLEDRFLLVAVDERTAPPSGCSIDALVHALETLETELGVDLTDHEPVYYRAQDGTVARDDRAGFARRVADGVVTLDTPVFDATLTRVEQLRQGALEVPAREAWHRRAFFGAPTPP